MVTAFLISTAWLRGEAAEQGLGISPGLVEAHVKEKIASSYPGGEQEFHEYLRASKQTEADVKLSVERGLIAGAIEQRLAGAEAKITAAQVAAYYNQHKARFAVPEARTLQITNRKSTAQGEQIKREVAAGKSFAGMSQSAVIDRPAKIGDNGPNIKDGLEKKALELAIFAARPGVLAGPVRFRVDYYVFEVRKIVPATYQPLRSVQASISQQLTSERRQASLARFVKAWRAKWTARTDCSAGYVISKCRQYRPSSTTPTENPDALE
jgi:parvulin-like peptidyl-prolyl isomerase